MTLLPSGHLSSRPASVWKNCLFLWIQMIHQFCLKMGDASKIVYWKTMDRVGAWGTKLWDSPRHLIFQCQVGPGFRMALGRSADHGSQLEGDFRQCQAMVIHGWLCWYNGGFPTISRIDSQSAGVWTFTWKMISSGIWASENMAYHRHLGVSSRTWNSITVKYIYIYHIISHYITISP